MKSNGLGVIVFIIVMVLAIFIKRPMESFIAGCFALMFLILAIEDKIKRG